jgi:GT2 family glycosyltransferase
MISPSSPQPSTPSAHPLPRRLGMQISALRGDLALQEALQAIGQGHPAAALLPLLSARSLLLLRDRVEALLGLVLGQLGRTDLARGVLERALLAEPGSALLWSRYRALEPTAAPAPAATPAASAPWQKPAVPIPLPQSNGGQAARVSILIPVYEGHEQTLECLSSVLRYRASNATPHEIIVLDDASPNEALVADLEALARAGLIEYCRQDTNLGFIKTINRGMAQCADRDVVWLNADTRVHGDWLDRLRSAAYCDERTASATPLSNNGELMSYPRMQVSSPMPDAIQQAQIDLLASLLAAPPIEIPMGCGFCFYIKRSALRAVGQLDEVHLERGYGEETDWCLRASQAGWRHVGAANVFVAHRGGVSFGIEKVLRVQQNNRLIRRRYPQADAICQRFRVADPVRKVKQAIGAQIDPPLPLHVLAAASPGGRLEEVGINALLQAHTGSYLVIADDLDRQGNGRQWVAAAKALRRRGFTGQLLLLGNTPWETELLRTGAAQRLPSSEVMSAATILQLCGAAVALTLAPDAAEPIPTRITAELTFLRVLRLLPGSSPLN